MGEQYCNTLGNGWLNRCYLGCFPSFIIDIGKTVDFFFNVLMLRFLSQIVFLVLFVKKFEHNEEIYDFCSKMNFFFSIPMSVVIGLYVIFKQPRPCKSCRTGKIIGSVYGMPSGHSMFSSIVSYFAFKKSIVLGFVFLISVPLSRICHGVHSILQTIIGSLFGLGYSFLCDYYPEICIPLAWIINFLLPFLCLFDPAQKKQEKNSGWNNHSWFIGGISTILFSIVYNPPNTKSLFFFMDNRMKIIFSFSNLIICTYIADIIMIEGLSLSLVPN